VFIDEEFNGKMRWTHVSWKVVWGAISMLSYVDNEPPSLSSSSNMAFIKSLWKVAGELSTKNMTIGLKSPSLLMNALRLRLRHQSFVVVPLVCGTWSRALFLALFSLGELT